MCTFENPIKQVGHIYRGEGEGEGCALFVGVFFSHHWCLLFGGLCSWDPFCGCIHAVSAWAYVFLPFLFFVAGGLLGGLPAAFFCFCVDNNSFLWKDKKYGRVHYT